MLVNRLAAVGSIILLLLAGVTPAHAAEQNSATANFTIDRYNAGELTPVNVQSRAEASSADSQTRLLLEDSDTSEVAIADLSLASSAAPAMWAATSSYVDLSWTALPGVSRYAVSSGGGSPVIVSSTTYRDTAVKAGQSINYRVEALFDEGDVGGGIWGFVAVVPSGVQSKAEAPNTKLNAAELSADLDVQLAALASYTSASVQHQTFIPDSRVNAPAVGCSYGSGYKFGGDNRGYGASKYPYRTRVQAVVGFTGSGTVTSSKTVGTTHVYNASGTLVASATASSANMSATRLAASTATSVDIRFKILATNPFCSAGAIDAAFTITVTKSGSWYITSGNHRQMPNHELYIHSNAGGWVTAYRRSYADPLCLLGAIACPLATMSGYAGAY